MSVTLEDVKNRINRVKKLILKKIADVIKKEEKRIPTEEEVIKIYEKRRAEHEKYVKQLVNRTGANKNKVPSDKKSKSK
jgi:hypothetical protein